MGKGGGQLSVKLAFVWLLQSEYYTTTLFLFLVMHVKLHSWSNSLWPTVNFPALIATLTVAILQVPDSNVILGTAQV